MDKTIRFIRTQADIDEQQRETYRYWASVSPGERALAGYGAPLAGISPTDFTDVSSGFHIGLPPSRIDILQAIAAVAFDEAWDSRIETIIDGDVPARVISRDHLIRNKLAFGTPQDLVDVEARRQAANLQQS